MQSGCNVVLDVMHWNQWARWRSDGKWCNLHEQNGWIYGYWVCGRPWGPVNAIYGQYPHTFLERALMLFKGLDQDNRLLHAPSGTLTGPGVTVDVVYDQEFNVNNPPTPKQTVPRRPQIVASVDDLPFNNETFDVILTDPPYTREEELIYRPGSKGYPLIGSMNEFHRILRPGGYVGMLHCYTGPPRRAKLGWITRAVIGVAPSVQMNRTRTFSIIQKPFGHEPKLSLRHQLELQF
jgi:hypothetical protein